MNDEIKRTITLPDVKFPYIWNWRKWPAGHDRKGQPCRVLARSKTMNTALIEFEDGYKMVSIRWGLRKRKGE